MWIGELNDHCGNCSIIDYCAEPYCTPHICAYEELADISCDLCEKIQMQAYNKAIDDFVNQFNVIVDEKCGTDTNNYFRKIVKEIAEQLKVGGENEIR